MPYLVQQNKRVARESIDNVGWPSEPVLAGGKHVVVIGGGDTASDCVGTAFRQGAVKVTQLDIRPQPPEKEDKLAVWPYWATKMRTSSSQAEGAVREFQVGTLELVGENGILTGVKCCQVDEKRKPIAGTEFCHQGGPCVRRDRLPRGSRHGCCQRSGRPADDGYGPARLDQCCCQRE
jgi:glutamate synthase (NADPH/NADH) small chain